MKPSSIVAPSRAQSGVSDQKPFAEGANMEVSAMSEGINRLRKLMEIADTNDHKDGLKAGLTWASKEAELPEVKALEDRFGDPNNLDLMRIWSDYDDYEAVASVVEAIEGDQVGRQTIEIFWEKAGFDDLNKLSKAFVKGWIEGALEVYDAAKDKV